MRLLSPLHVSRPRSESLSRGLVFIEDVTKISDNGNKRRRISWALEVPQNGNRYVPVKYIETDKKLTSLGDFTLQESYPHVRFDQPMLYSRSLAEPNPETPLDKLKKEFEKPKSIWGEVKAKISENEINYGLRDVHSLNRNTRKCFETSEDFLSLRDHNLKKLFNAPIWEDKENFLLKRDASIWVTFYSDREILKAKEKGFLLERKIKGVYSHQPINSSRYANLKVLDSSLATNSRQVRLGLQVASHRDAVSIYESKEVFNWMIGTKNNFTKITSTEDMTPATYKN